MRGEFVGPEPGDAGSGRGGGGRRGGIGLALDTEERTVEVPPASAAALATDDVAKATFDGLAYSHRKEYARWIKEAKKEETRERCVAKALEMLREGRTRS